MVATRRTPKKNRSPSPSPLADGGSTRSARKSSKKTAPSLSTAEEQVARGERSPSPSPRKRPDDYPEAVDEWRTEWSEKFGEWYWWHEKTMQVSWCALSTARCISRARARTHGEKEERVPVYPPGRC